MAQEMTYLTDQQRRAVEAQDSIFLDCCAGSGKTRVLVAKLLEVTGEIGDTTRQVACITYTNPATDEIHARLIQQGHRFGRDSGFIGTIHSFCIQRVLRPYSWLDSDVPQNFKVLVPHSDAYQRIVRTTEGKIGRPFEESRYNSYQNLRMSADGSPSGSPIDQGKLTKEDAECFWENARQEGYLDFSMVLYYTLRILNRHQFVSQAIAAQFAWILIDEYQDTADIQLKILSAIYLHSLTKFFLVGDKHQSIMGFAGVRPQQNDEFVDAIGAQTDISLVENFRSTSSIVSCANRLMPRSQNMVAVGQTANCQIKPIWVNVAQSVDAVEHHFLPAVKEAKIDLGNCAILAPQWRVLKPIATRLRELEVAVGGLDDWPYRRRGPFAELLEYVGACVGDDLCDRLPALASAVYRIVDEVTGVNNTEMLSHKGLATALEIVRSASNRAKSHSNAVKWIEVVASDVVDILCRDGWIGDSSREILVRSASEVIADIQAACVSQGGELSVTDLGVLAESRNVIQLMTIHKAKGREFDAVAIVSANFGLMPYSYNNWMAAKESEVEAGRRQFYVGITRAKKLLLVSSDQEGGSQPSPYIKEAGFSMTETFTT